MHTMCLNMNPNPEALELLMQSLRHHSCTVHSFELVTVANEYDVHLSFSSPHDAAHLANVLARVEHLNRVRIIRAGRCASETVQ